MKKKLVSLIVGMTLALITLTGCGKDKVTFVDQDGNPYYEMYEPIRVPGEDGVEYIYPEGMNQSCQDMGEEQDKFAWNSLGFDSFWCSCFWGCCCDYSRKSGHTDIREKPGVLSIISEMKEILKKTT